MTALLIQTLLPFLPRFAEEEGDFFSVKREILINHLLSTGYQQDIADNTVMMLENLLDTLATLNPDALQKGEWCFVSFPAQLLATSVLTALSDTNSRLFASNFWNTQSIANDKKDQQRDVLSLLENARCEHHASQQAKPIRYCYVAWSIIKLDDKILFYQREDTKKRHDKAAGDYGLIGGRANQNDISLANKDEVLNALQSPDSELIRNFLPETLKRELREETGLLFDEHYTFKPWRTLKPYRQVQGSAPNHALTEYYLDIFQIDLTLEGYLFLQQKIKNDERLVWFSIEEMTEREGRNEKNPYIKALYDDFDGDRSVLATKLTALPDSFSSCYLFQRTKYGLTLPVDYQKPMLAGVLGKEKPLGLSLTDRELAIILGLASHLRGFKFLNTVEGITFHPNGWVEVNTNTSIQSELINLASLFNDTDLTIENHRDLFFRLSISPEVVYFDESLFSFVVKADDLMSTQSKIPVVIYRESFDTAFGCVEKKSEEFKLALELTNKFKLIFERPHSSDNEMAEKTEGAYKHGLHKKPAFLAMGLIRLIGREAGIIKFVINYVCNNGNE